MGSAKQKRQLQQQKDELADRLTGEYWEKQRKKQLIDAFNEAIRLQWKTLFEQVLSRPSPLLKYLKKKRLTDESDK